MVENIDVISTAVVPLVGVVGRRKQEVGKQEVVRVIDSWLGLVAVVPLVGGVFCSKQEGVRVIDSWLVLC